MGDSESTNPASDGERHLLAAAHHIVRALSANANVSEDMRKTLADLETHLSRMTLIGESDAKLIIEIEDWLKCAQRKIASWQSNRSMVWDSGPQEAAEYLQAVGEVQKVIDSLKGLPSKINGKQRELLHEAHSVLQMAMTKLEQELEHILIQNKLSFGPVHMSFGSCDVSVGYEGSVVSTEDDSVEGTPKRKSCSATEFEEYVMDLVHPDVISDMKSIANVMFASNFDKEFCHTFVTFWKDALDDYMIVCHMDRLGVEDVFKMKWNSLSCRISKWCRAMKSIIRFYLGSQKRLFDQVFGELGSVSSNCFIEASQGSLMRLLNFGEAAAIGPVPPERLFGLLDMYEVVVDLLQDIDYLFSEGAGSFLRIQSHELLRRLGDSVSLTFMKFGKYVASDRSTNQFQKGGIHHLTKYVMNYMNLLAVYGDTLSSLLEKLDRVDLSPGVVNVEDQQDLCSHPMDRQLWSVMSILEANLDGKSKLYRDDSLMHIFMMNNIHYMVKKVKDSKLSAYLGNEWILENIVKFRQHASRYLSDTWSQVVGLIRHDEKQGKTILKKRCKNFNAAFEEVYKSQAGWHVPDPELRETLRILVVQKVIPPYRNFSDTISSSIGERHIKYSEDDLEKYIYDLFEGSARILQHHQRR